MQEEIIRTILKFYPDTQAIYLFGSFDTVDEWPDSDLDIGLLLPPLQAGNALFSALDLCNEALADYARKDIVKSSPDWTTLSFSETVFWRL